MTANGANNLLTEAQGTIEFDAVEFMQKDSRVNCMGWDTKATKRRWVMY